MKKLAKKVAKDTSMQEYFRKQKKLFKETLRGIAKRVGKAIDNVLK